ncbi:MAG: hypothetical protein E7C72_05755 [Dialister sp.]|nr:hypothetical protein [Dialister sp.]
MRFESCPRLSGKVSTARLTKGASWSRYGRIETRVSRHKSMTARVNYFLCIKLLTPIMYE